MKKQCQHIKNEDNITKSLQGRKIFKDQCVRCFHQPMNESGLFVCMKCFNGFCILDRDIHTKEHKHCLFVNIIMIEINIEQKYEVTKLAIGKEGGAVGGPQYKSSYEVYCNQCKSSELDGCEILDAQVKSLINTDSPYRKQNIASWEIEVNPCEHTLTLEQEPKNKDLMKCSSCDLSTNLWLCLTCGSTGCGRKFYDGSGGNNHAIDHSQKQKHPLVVKLGTITAEGQASLYCYACNNDVKDGLLTNHLRVLGIDIQVQEKTQKTMTEMNLDYNLNFSLSKLIESNDPNTKIMFCCDYTGMQNIGNSCYLNSVIQTLNNLGQFKEQYSLKGKDHLESCKRIPANCFYCQVSKIFWGLNSGKYSQKKIQKKVINEKEVQEEYQEAIKPYDFKLLLADKNAEFASSRQQDALEYLQWIFDRLQTEEPKYGMTLPKMFNFTMLNRLVCSKCNNYKLISNNTNQWKFPVIGPSQHDIQSFYASLENEKDEDVKKSKLCEDPEYFVKFQECIQLLKVGDSVEASCSSCKTNTEFISNSYFSTMPKYLLAIANRFVVEKWVPKKLNANILMPQKLDLSDFTYKNAKQVKGNVMKEQKKKKYSEQNVAMLGSMGYDQNTAIRALSATNDNLEGAMNYIMDNMDKNLSAPIEQEGQQDQNIDVGAIQQIKDMGFDQNQAKIALIKTKSNVQQALQWLFSVDGDVSGFMNLLEPAKKQKKQMDIEINPLYQLKGVIVHLGKSVHHGHYVVYLKKNKEWVLYNDQKVTIPSLPYLGKGYIYIYENA